MNHIIMKCLNFIIEIIVMLHDKFQFHKSIYQQIVTPGMAPGGVTPPPPNVRSRVGHGWSKLVTDGQNLQFYVANFGQNTNFTPPIWS